MPSDALHGPELGRRSGTRPGGEEGSRRTDDRTRQVEYTLVGKSRGPNLAEVRVVDFLIRHFQYVGLFLVLLGAGLGLPVPEEVPVVAAGVLSRAGIFRWWLALPVCLVGALAGDAVLYWTGHHWGERVLDWRPVRRILPAARAARLLVAYREHGAKIVFGARHVMGLRAAAFLTAGIARVPFWKFLAADAAAACLGLPAGFALAFAFADRVESVLADVHRVERWAALVAVLTVAVWLALRAYRKARRA